MQKKTFPKLPLKKVRNILISIFLLAGVFSGGYLLGIKGFQARLNQKPEVIISKDLPEEQKELNFDLFWRVWDTLETKYYDQDKLVDSDMVYGAIRGLVAAIGDPYTVFLPPSENKVVQEDLSGSFEGVGIQIGFKGIQLAVVSPLPDSPAQEAGVKAGDYIVGIKDTQKGIDRGTVGITLPDAVQAIRGPEGSTVTLTLLRGESEEPIVVDIVRKSIEVPSVRVSYVGDQENIAHIKLIKFSGDTLDEWERVVIDLLKKKELEGVILDVRNNPGGYLQAAVDIASEFLETGEVVVTEESIGDYRQEFLVEKFGRLRNQEVVVLINGGSASASEILAGALRDQLATQLVGETSFGKGTIQEPQQVDGGAGLHITIARWLTPSGFWVDEGGLEPDIAIEDNPETPEDEQLEEAINLLQS